MKKTKIDAIASATLPLVWLLVLPLVFLLASPLKAQQGRAIPQQDRPSSPAAPPEQGMTSVFTDSSKDYLISPGDVIEIKVEDAPELSYHYRVTAAGDIDIPVLGRVVAHQKTTYELGRIIANVLRDQEYLKNPNVVVTVRQYNSRAFFIQGAVGKPGLYQVEGRPSLLTLIGMAGGLAENHGSTIFILRPSNTKRLAPDTQEKTQAQTLNSDPNPTSASQRSDSGSGIAADYEMIKVNLTSLYKGQFNQNQRLEPGDIVNIPRSDVFFVAGEVKAPGSFALKDGTTLRQAVSLAQGMTFKAKSSGAIIFREDAVTGSRQEIKVDIGAVMSGKKEDMLVRANDVIIIPNSQAKSVGGAILTTIGLNSLMYRLWY
jgi:polysaccharide biosynthesis/export protein